MSPSSQPPIRFRLGFSSPSTLLAELNRVVNRGEVVLPIGRPAAVGTRFLFDLQAPGVSPGVEVLGEVVGVVARGPGSYELTIRYARGAGRAGVDAALARLAEAHRYEQVREYPRIPFHLSVREAAGGPHFLVRDISRGGVGVELIAPGPLPSRIREGETALLELTLEPGVLCLHGEVVWTCERGGAFGGARPGFGVRFGRLRPATQALLDRVLALELLPGPLPPPLLSFGEQALDRMP